MVILHITSTLQERMSLRFLRLLIRSMAKSSTESTLTIFQFTFFPENWFYCCNIHLAKQISASTCKQAYSLPCLFELSKKGPTEIEGEICTWKCEIQTGKCSRWERSCRFKFSYSPWTPVLWREAPISQETLAYFYSSSIMWQYCT